MSGICGALVRPFMESDRTVVCYRSTSHQMHEGVIDDLDGSRTVVQWQIDHKHETSNA